MGPHDYHISKLLFVLLRESGLSLGVLSWFWLFVPVFVGGRRGGGVSLGPTGFCKWLTWDLYCFLWAWVILGFRGCCVSAGSGHWSGVGTLNVLHSGVPLCLAFRGILLLAVVRGEGLGCCVYLWWWGPCFGLSVWSGGH